MELHFRQHSAMELHFRQHSAAQHNTNAAVYAAHLRTLSARQQPYPLTAGANWSGAKDKALTQVLLQHVKAPHCAVHILGIVGDVATCSCTFIITQAVKVITAHQQ
jgi:hypothetical protein